MKNFKIGQLENGKFTCWYTGNTMQGMKDFLKYIIDTFNNPKSFIIVNVEEKKAYNAYDIAINFFKLHKRTLAEKLEA